MAAIFTLQFGTYAFPNQTFEIQEHRLDFDTPVQDVRRMQGGVVLQNYTKPRTVKINGRIFGRDKGSVANSFSTLMKSIHNSGDGASLLFRSDRYIFAHAHPSGVVGSYEKGLYEHLINVDIALIARRPCSESIAFNKETGNRTNNSAAHNVTVGGDCQTQGIWTIVAGTWDFGTQIRIENTANSQLFTFLKDSILAGQTLVIDNALGCVLLHDGLTMIDAMCYFSGDLFMDLEPGGTNQLVIDGATMDYTLEFHDRWYT